MGRSNEKFWTLDKLITKSGPMFGHDRESDLVRIAEETSTPSQAAKEARGITRDPEVIQACR